MPPHHPIEVGFQVYATEGSEVFGAVRRYPSDTTTLVISIGHAGDFEGPVDAIQRVHDGKVIVQVGRLDACAREAVAHAHDREEPGA